jgi:hypothetical protein
MHSNFLAALLQPLDLEAHLELFPQEQLALRLELTLDKTLLLVPVLAQKLDLLR